jgi:TonB-linked SusC/RagA family outer membrane protein
MIKTKLQRFSRCIHLPLLLGALLWYQPAECQQPANIQGRVTSVGNGNPLAGVSIQVKGTTRGTTTNNDGHYSLSALPGDTIEFTSIGFEPARRVLGAQRTVDVGMVPSSSQLNDIVVIGYGTAVKKDITGSIAVVDVKDARKTASYDMAKILQGHVAGVTVQGSGEPGGFVQIKLRGISTFGNNSPLFVIDGVPTDAPYDFSPDDIQSIQVLKGPSAAAIYGSRAATGVIIVTTKKGEQGPLKVNYSGYIGVQNIARKIPVADREQYQKITSAAELNAGLTIAPANDPTNPDYVSDINTDWQKVALKTGVIQDHNVNMSGGGQYATYDVGLGYFNQTGTQVGPQNYDRYTVTSRLDGHRGRFTYGVKFAYSQSHKGNYAATTGHAVFGGTVTSLLTAIPTMPVYDSTRLGGYGGSDQVKNRAISANVVGINNLVQDYNNRSRVAVNGWGQLEIVKNLDYKLNLSYDRTDYKNFHYEPKFDMGYYYLNNDYYLTEQLGQGDSKLMENTLTYKFTAGRSKVDLLAGMTYQEDHSEYMLASASDTSTLDFHTFGAISNPGAKGVTSYLDAATLVSYLGRVNYNYDDRYLLTLNFRRDGSSRFSPLHRYGNFAGFAAAWNLSNEKFLHLPDQVSHLKIRGGYGELGNQNFGNYLFQSYIDGSANYLFNNVLATGATTVSVADPSLRWESTQTSNVAIDLGLFDERLTFTAEYFNRKSKDIITNIPIPYSVGSFPQTLTTNAASLRNTGLEFTAEYKKVNGKFTYDISANASTLKNRVLALGGTNNPIYGSGSKTAVGREVGELFGFKTEGLFQSTDDVKQHATQTGAAPGDVKFVDENGDGVISDEDRVYLGSAIPKVYYGLTVDASYKNFDLSFFWQGNAGNKVFNGVYQALMAGQYGNDSKDELNYWTPTHTDTKVPRPVIGDPNGNNRFSDLFVENGSYLKLQNAEIGYTIPSGTLQTKHIITSLRVYVSGQNLVTISRYKGYDPDFISDGLFSRGFDYGSFPNPRAFIFGVQLGF